MLMISLVSTMSLLDRLNPQQIQTHVAVKIKRIKIQLRKLTKCIAITLLSNVINYQIKAL